MQGTSNGNDNSGDPKSNYCLADIPVGLRVLVVDDDRTSLRIVHQMLRRCRYKVTGCLQAREALAIVKRNKSQFDILLIDLHMPGMDGLELLEMVRRDIDLPIVMMSDDEEEEIVMKVITYGACDYLIKPLRMEALKILWQHVVRKRNANPLKELTNAEAYALGDDQVKHYRAEQVNALKVDKAKILKSKGVEGGEDAEPPKGSGSKGKKRMAWTKELHESFVKAYDFLGHERAVPMKILDCMRSMGVTDITRENVASHLQKFRIYKRKQEGIPDHECELVTYPGIPRTSVFERSLLLDRYTLQGAQATSQMPQCLTYPQTNTATMVASSSNNILVNNQRGLNDCNLTEADYYRSEAMMPQMMFDPSLLHQFCDENDIFNIALMERDVAQPLAIEYSKSNYQSDGK